MPHPSATTRPACAITTYLAGLHGHSSRGTPAHRVAAQPIVRAQARSFQRIVEKYRGYCRNGELMITAMLHKTDDTPWTPEELHPVKAIRIMEATPSGSVLGAEITLADNTTHQVDYKNIDGLKNC